jgi:7-carboxy-7-deazaguanine synthase
MLSVYSIFNSISGEAGPIPQGSFCTFLRLAGCNLDCKWCDTEYARTFVSGEKLSIQTVLGLLILTHAKNPSGNLVITGGEPLAQKNSLGSLLSLVNPIFPRLFDIRKMNIQIETNGTLSPVSNDILKKTPCVIDIKPPSAGPCYKKVLPFVDVQVDFCEGSYLKFLVGDKKDYEYAKAYLANVYSDKFHYAFSVVKGLLPHNDLYQWLLKDGLSKKYRNLILNAQLHKELGLQEHN